MIRTIGVVGCGAIGQAILQADLPVRVAGVHTRTEERARGFLGTLKEAPPLLSLPELVEVSDLVVEAAGGHAVPSLAEAAFGAGKGLMVISVGALLEHPEIAERARKLGVPLLIPSGAIAGLDGVKAACQGQVDYVRLTSRKPPRALDGAPYLTKHGISLTDLAGERELFFGPAREAAKGFPDNLNVSAALSLAGLGPDKTEVRVIAVPGLQRNCHDIEVEGYFGRLHLHIENIPSENPKTGRMTALSIIRALRDAVDSVRIGT
jgi:aspartate dehydrogenase